MELLTIILLIIIGILTFLLLKKERVLGINIDNHKVKDQVKIIENKDYRKNIYDLLNFFLYSKKLIFIFSNLYHSSIYIFIPNNITFF